MRRATSGLVTGVLFAVGLGIAGMTQPSKVIGFLDVFGAWDPTLVFVMAAAVVTYGLLRPRIERRPTPLFDGRFHLPTRRDLDARLVGGAAIFGVGWGLAGYCPGPGLVSLATGAAAPLIFVAAMIAGMKLEHLRARRGAER